MARKSPDLPQLPLTTPMYIDGSMSRPWIAALQALGANPETSSSGYLADIPTWLKPSDVGYQYTATDYSRTFRWTGSAWVRADGAADPHRYIWCDESPGAGWAIANGASVQRTKPDGTLESFTPKNLTGYYVKGSSSAAAGTAATAPTMTGNPTGTVTVSANSSFSSVAAGTGGAVSVAAPSHSHTATFTGSRGTLAVNNDGEPAHVSLIPYYRL
jgi:hypothetical protein